MSGLLQLQSQPVFLGYSAKDLRSFAKLGCTVVDSYRGMHLRVPVRQRAAAEGSKLEADWVHFSPRENSALKQNGLKTNED